MGGALNITAVFPDGIVRINQFQDEDPIDEKPSSKTGESHTQFKLLKSKVG